MIGSNPVSRLTAYYKRHGFGATLRRFSVAARRTLFAGRSVLFYCDLSALGPATEVASGLKVERHRNQVDLSPQDLQEITSFWNPDLARRNLSERFGLGASLWVIRFDNQLAGYGWTLQGRTVEPHYFRLGPDDVHLFDFHVFPQYRGRKMNPLLVSYILHTLAVECRGRAFIEAAEWNQPQLASLSKTSFNRLSSARKFTILGHTIVCWGRGEGVGQRHEFENEPFAATAGKLTRAAERRAGGVRANH
jgi:ribosomal protein S18 acetylase RimI-like enzyme